MLPPPFQNSKWRYCFRRLHTSLLILIHFDHWLLRISATTEAGMDKLPWEASVFNMILSPKSLCTSFSTLTGTIKSKYQCTATPSMYFALCSSLISWQKKKLFDYSRLFLTCTSNLTVYWRVRIKYRQGCVANNYIGNGIAVR